MREIHHYHKDSCLEINDDKRAKGSVCVHTCVHIHTYTLSAEVELSESRKLPFHQRTLKVTTLSHSNHMESREKYSAPFQVKGGKKSREFPEQKLVLFLPLKIGFCSWQFLSKPCIPFYLSFSGLTVITGPRLKKMLQFSLGLPRSKEIFSLKSGLVDLLSAALNSTSHCSPR